MKTRKTIVTNENDRDYEEKGDKKDNGESDD